MFKQIIVMRSDLKMSTGKACAQAAHASLEAYLRASKKDTRGTTIWLAEGMAKIVLKVGSEEELSEFYNRAKGKFPCAIIRDAGRTQLKPGTATCFAAGPANEDLLDSHFGDLKLY